MKGVNEFIKSFDDFRELERRVQEKKEHDIGVDIVRIDMMLDSLCERISELESANFLLRFKFEQIEKELKERI